MKITIYWTTNNRDIISRIRKRFNLSTGITVNGETPAEIGQEDMPDLQKTEQLGYIKIRIKPL